MSLIRAGRALLQLSPAARRLLAEQPRRAASRLPVGNSLELGFHYRHPGRIARDQHLIMEGFGGFIWFYILYNTYNHPAMVFGHESYPNPRKWTDAELGIPPLD